MGGWLFHYSLKCQPVDYSDDPIAVRVSLLSPYRHLFLATFLPFYSSILLLSFQFFFDFVNWQSLHQNHLCRKMAIKEKKPSNNCVFISLKIKSSRPSNNQMKTNEMMYINKSVGGFKTNNYSAYLGVFISLLRFFWQLSCQASYSIMGDSGWRKLFFFCIDY